MGRLNNRMQLTSGCRSENHLADAMQRPPNSFFRVEENGVLYLTIGYVETEEEPGWFDQALLFCPFWGRPLQVREEVRKRAGSAVH